MSFYLKSPLYSTKSYRHWINNFESLSSEELDHMKSWLFNLSDPPYFSIILPVYKSNIFWLKQAVDSVFNQFYPYWQLCISDDYSCSDELINYLTSLRDLYPEKVKLNLRTSNGHISENSNDALKLSNFEWIALLDHDDLLSFDALFWMSYSIKNNPSVKLLYSDEDKIDTLNKRSQPFFKSNFDPFLIYGQNYFSHLGVFNKKLITRIGGFRKGYEGSQDYDLTLRCLHLIKPKDVQHVPRVLYHWRIHNNSTSLSSTNKSYASISAIKSLENYHHNINNIGSVFKLLNGYKFKPSIQNSRVVLTGTPIPNGYEDIYNLTKFIYPFKFKSILKFHYSQLQELSKTANNDEEVGNLKENLSPFFMRIRKEDLKELPIIKEKEVSIKMGDYQDEIYYFSHTYN